MITHFQIKEPIVSFAFVSNEYPTSQPITQELALAEI